MQSKVKIIRTTEGYMVELPDGEYLCDIHGDNLWDTRDEAEDVVATTYVDLSNYIEDGVKPRLLEAQLRAYPDSIVLTDHQMYDALRSEIPRWTKAYEFRDWRYYDDREEIGELAPRFFEQSMELEIERTRARWARNALLYKWQTPDGFFYACIKKEDGTYTHVGFRYGLEESEYASGFDGMGYTPTEVK
jgi:hypothetical protein